MLEQDHPCDAPHQGQQAEEGPYPPKNMPLFKVIKIALVLLSDLFLGAGRLGHGSNEAQSSDGVPRGEQ